MAMTLEFEVLFCLLCENPSSSRAEKVEKIIQYAETEANATILNSEKEKVIKFVKLFELKMNTVGNRVQRFKLKFKDWLNDSIELKTSCAGAPIKHYDNLGDRSKKMRLSEVLSTRSDSEVKDSFMEVLKRNNQPAEATKIADILPEASPKRLKRIVESIPTPPTPSEFSEEEALALMLELKLSKNKYIKLNKALRDKGYSILPGYNALLKTKQKIIPKNVIGDDSASVELSKLLENTASRLISTFSEKEAMELHNQDLTLICKWGCDGLSGLPEYKQPTSNQSTKDYKSVFMASLVPLRLRRKCTEPSTSKDNNKYVWLNSSPGSKSFCRPIKFEYLKENASNTKNWVDGIKHSIENLSPVCIDIHGYFVNVNFELQLTMIDGKVSNAITETHSTWQCSLCGKKKSEFQETPEDTSTSTAINRDVLEFGISPLHARIRFLEFMLHIAYDLKYRNICGNELKSVRNNKELIEMRSSEKKRIQDEFKTLTGLNIDKPLVGYGSTNDGNTARRFFENYEITSKITGIDEEVLRKCYVILSALNSKYEINAEKFHCYALNIFTRIRRLYSWKDITPTVHKVLQHGSEIIESNLLPLGELTEEAQEARNSDFKFIQLFNTRKCSRKSQNQDLINYLLLSSDPVLSIIRKKWCSSNTITSENEHLKEVLNILDCNDYFTENI